MDNDISISMIIDKDIKKNFNNSENICFKPLPIKNKLNIDERKIYSWVDDRIITNCTKCDSRFSILNRKHHCRNCGKIFCHKCTDYFISIPDRIKTVDKQYNYLDIKTYLDFFNINNVEERVCEKCYFSINELKKLTKTLELFEMLPLTIDDYKKIAQVSCCWNKISKYYFNKFREIQYNFPDHKYDDNEINVINYNKYTYYGHSKWILQLILNTDWNGNSCFEKEKVLNIVKSKKKTHHCWYLMCSRSCSSTLQIEDIIIIISKNYMYTPLIKYLIKLFKEKFDCIVNNASINQEINCYLYVIINSLHFYKNYTNISLLLEDFLLYISKKNINVSNQLFWMLNPYINNPRSSLYFKEFRLKLVKQLDKGTYKLFQNGFDFTQNIIKVALNNRDNELESIKDYLKEYNTKIDNFVLPLDIEASFKYIDYNQIRMIDSKTKPIILPCISDNNYTRNIMLKKEDIRKEEIIMKIIKLMDCFLKSEENLDLQATTYNILPISDEYGYIEFVPNSITLYDIKEVHKFSIQNWLIENNKNISVHDLRENISKSCALYCIITYLLGIGDRHLDNIMITNEGKIFHIDFGYILGNDPKYISPDIRLTYDMIDAMGGINSQYYHNFKEYCGKAYNCIRRHASVFYVLLLEIVNLNPPLKDKINMTEDKIKFYIINRFTPGENYEEAIKQINNRIERNSNTYSETIIDYFHKTYKNSDSEKDIKILNLAKNAVKNTWKNHIKKYIKGTTNSL